jgi:hypothetical protein
MDYKGENEESGMQGWDIIGKGTFPRRKIARLIAYHFPASGSLTQSRKGAERAFGFVAALQRFD